MIATLNDISSESFSSPAEYEEVKAFIYKLWSEKEQYRKLLFGKKSEKYIPENTGQLIFEGIDTKDEEDIITTEIKSHLRHKKIKKQPKRNALPLNLPRKILNIIPEDVKGNEDQYIKIGEEISEQLEMKPISFWIKRIVRAKYKHISDKNIICAPMPNNLFSKCIAGSSVISSILTSKYADHLPLYRINKIFKRSKIIINESTMVGWIAYACIYLEMLYNRMHENMKKAGLIQADESPIPVLEKNNPKTHRGYMFVYVVDKKYALYDYCPGRGREGPVSFLDGFHGILQTDGYDGYNEAVKKYKLKHIACMAHIRRKFYDAFEKGEKESETALLFIKELYKIEKEIKDEPECDIKSVRTIKAEPVLTDFYNWAVNTQSQSLPQSDTRKAINYFLNEHNKMKLYIEYPNADIDNNLCERTIRPMTIGRKNYLFAGSENGAHRMAIIYTLVLTCRIHDIDPYKYFNRVFEMMAENPGMELDQLLPDRIEL